MMRVRFFLILVIFVCFASAMMQAHAQDLDLDIVTQGRAFKTKVRATDAVTLMSGKTRIYLWGVQNIGAVDAVQKLRARIALDNVVGGRTVDCEWKARSGERYFAQCLNHGGLDIGLYMIQQGYGVAERAAVYNTPFEEPYVQAEMQAQDQGLGVWQLDKAAGAGAVPAQISTMAGIVFVLFLCMIGAFGFLSLTIMRGFQRVIDAQNDNANLVAAQHKLRDKERQLVASILESEIKANKSKVEAYIVVYEEVLEGLRDVRREPKYKETGDLVQMQPALERHVFDRNTDKLDLLGDRISSEIIHFYARVKSEPEYKNLEPSMAREEAVALVQSAIDGAQRINTLAGQLLDSLKIRKISDDVEIGQTSADLGSGPINYD